MIIDSLLLEKIEEVSHSIQRWTGLTCFHLARISYLLMLAVNIFMPDGSIFLLRALSPVFSLWVFSKTLHFIDIDFLPLPYRLKIIKKIEAEVTKNLGKGLRNKRANCAGRSFVVTALPLGTLLYCLTSSKSMIHTGSCCMEMLIIPILFYLISCTPLPPSKSKVRQWIDKWVEFFKNEPELMPSPSPA